MDDAPEGPLRSGDTLAEVAELADALASGASPGNRVEVRVLSSAPLLKRANCIWPFSFHSPKIADELLTGSQRARGRADHPYGNEYTARREL